MYPKKCKLQLIQPQIMCFGRDRVTSYYRGLIESETEGYYVISFKYKGKLIKTIYMKDSGFKQPELRDIKLI